eukprot:6458148-Amphidinium_carterae.1
MEGSQSLSHSSFAGFVGVTNAYLGSSLSFTSGNLKRCRLDNVEDASVQREILSSVTQGLKLTSAWMPQIAQACTSSVAKLKNTLGASACDHV